MEQMGAPADVIAEARTRLLPSDFELFEDNLPSFHLFQRLRTQWRTRGMDGDICGLDYAVVPAVMRLLHIAPGRRSQCFEDIQLMELETLTVVAEKKRAAQK